MSDRQMEETRGIGFSIYGEHPVYIRGMLENCHLARRFYPDWQVYIYTDGSTNCRRLEEFLEAGAIVKRRQCPSSWMSRSGRYFIAEEVDRFIVRDADSRIGHREVCAVKEWIESGKPYHFMHDHNGHRAPIMGGMWGAVTAALPDNFIKQLEDFNAPDRRIDQDQILMQRILWAGMTPDKYMHHHSRGFDCGHSIPFPTPMLGREFIGDTYYKSNEKRSVVRVQEKLDF